ncbi:STAS domain protein [Stieleria maiorica]|uniref:STAS domain protein n=1 Tax=Stieleria maiorica TaxID=2795974 RepID=A0A5B9MK12_9BACT|nr:STAS domain-containing protein [Stieleria maiorica]QEG01612.1 STAS domain protein [Stieleria maiorica]
MSSPSAVEIHFHDSSMVVSPSLKVINRRKSAGQISSRVSAELDQPRECLVTDVVIDLGQVTWISSAGLNELIRLQAQSRASGVNLRLRSLSETVRDVFRITRLERMFEFEGLGDDEFAVAAPTAEIEGAAAAQATVSV